MFILKKVVVVEKKHSFALLREGYANSINYFELTNRRVYF